MNNDSKKENETIDFFEVLNLYKKLNKNDKNLVVGFLKGLNSKKQGDN